MKTEDFERMKALCEKEGFELLNANSEDNEKYYIIAKKKDIWKGVYFAKVGKIRKIKSIDANRVYFDDDSWAYKENCDPSTEQAYVEQLKKEAFIRFGEIKEGDAFDRSWIAEYFNVSKIGDISDYLGTGYFYKENLDSLFYDGIEIYRSGEWAKRVPERIKVGVHRTGYFNNHKLDEVCYFNPSFTMPHVPEDWDIDSANQFLASQLESYLNADRP